MRETPASVDVILPTRNRFHLTRRAIDSVVEQTFEDWRLLVVDDGSDDGSRDQLRELVGPRPRIHLIERPEPGGAQVARQTAFGRTNARLVAILDSDDWWAPGKLQRQMKTYRRASSADADVGAVLCAHVWVDDSGTPVESISMVERTRRDLARLRPDVSRGRTSPLVSDNMSSLLVEREVVERAGGFLPPRRLPLRTCEDVEFYVRVTQQCAFAFVDEPLVCCQMHADERTSDALKSSLAADELATVLDIHAATFGEWPLERAVLEARTAARYLAAGRRGAGLCHFLAALRSDGPAATAMILRRFGPYVAKALLDPRR